MDSSIITVLGIILLILIVLNHITIISSTVSTNTSNTSNASCSQTSFGCCPNGVDSKINYYGTNCPGYKPGPGYYPSPYVPNSNQIPGPKPIGGCAGTRYGCCPNNNTPKINEQGSNCLVK